MFVEAARVAFETLLRVVADEVRFVTLAADALETAVFCVVAVVPRVVVDVAVRDAVAALLRVVVAEAVERVVVEAGAAARAVD